ncbi:c-type cytochrome [Pseudomonas capsici]|uniref:c-type cytochrome n=1 Tax=Pseudomonas capsici TaxID=2810614 RepID=UPI0021F1F117|nr:c-type cytochrome [Pseudomonas capsici]MCV4342570.1 c-type cytochrome [Pseudomonas capsici]
MRFLVGLVAVPFYFFASFAFADVDVDEAGVMATNGCVNCHGVEGRGTKVGNIPALAGRPKEFLVTVMVGYKRGTLQGTVMNRIMKDFDEQKIDFLANYFSSIK